jgi:iron(III) transport system substrate-binding protein
MLPLVSICSKAPSKSDSFSLAQIALYEGGDRQERLLAGARQEGEVMLYTSMAVDDAAPLTRVFEEKYGVKVNLWRASSVSVRQRVMSEAQAGRFNFDVAEINGLELEALHLENLLQSVKSSHHRDLMPQAMPSHQEWSGTRLNLYVQAYNTNHVKKEELPRSFHDLLELKWRGRLGIESNDPEWFATVVQELGEEKGLQLFQEIVATNGLFVRTGHTLLINLVASGEIPLTLTAYRATVEKSKQKGAPVEWFVIPPPVVLPNGVAVSRRAPHPHAALLFYEFMISEAQHILPQQHRVPVVKNPDASLNEATLKFVDIPSFLDQFEKWAQLYEDIVIQQ